MLVSTRLPVRVDYWAPPVPITYPASLSKGERVTKTGMREYPVTAHASPLFSFSSFPFPYSILSPAAPLNGGRLLVLLELGLYYRPHGA